jgi:Family of unknown function (DUF5678)
MTEQVAEVVERKLKTAGIKPTSEEIKENAVIAQVSGTQFHILKDSVRLVAVYDTMPEETVKKNLTESFPSYFKLIQSIVKLPENIDEKDKYIINKKIEEAWRTVETITRNIVEDVSTNDKTTINKIPSSEVQKKTNLDWIISNPPELEQYKGKYVAIENAKVVGSGKTSVEAFTQAKKDNPGRKVLLKLVSDSDIGM